MNKHNFGQRSGVVLNRVVHYSSKTPKKEASSYSYAITMEELSIFIFDPGREMIFDICYFFKYLANGEGKMIKHVVIWKLKETAMGATKYENALAMKTRLEALSEKIPQIISIEVGINITVSATAGDVVLISTFADDEALETYTNHPEHKKVADFVSSVRLERTVVDYVVN